jgi:hypothetical protein
MVHVKARFDAEQGAVIERAIEMVAADLPRAARDHGRPTSSWR